jgi:CDP-glucose 4,6-dehydratase
MAAQALVRESYKDPIETYSTNVMGTINMFEAARQTPSVKAVLNITSDKCYENDERLYGYRESDSLGGYDPYSSSKACAELVSSAYNSSFMKDAGVAVASVRAGNVIGGGDWGKDRVVPDAVRAFMEDNELLIRNPSATRPWQHVLEPLSGYILLCQQLINDPSGHTGSWNFGANDIDAQPVSNLVGLMCDAWGGNARWSDLKGLQPHEARYLKLDCNKAKSKLDWHPIWNLERAVSETASWYKAWHKKSDMRDFTLGQIETYQREHIAK